MGRRISPRCGSVLWMPWAPSWAVRNAPVLSERERKYVDLAMSFSDVIGLADEVALVPTRRWRPLRRGPRPTTATGGIRFPVRMRVIRDERDLITEVEQTPVLGDRRLAAVASVQTSA